MATVTGITAARMLAIDGQSIVDGDIVGDDLVLTKRSGATINAGNVRGVPGDTAIVVTEIGNAVDLDTMLTPGYYVQSQNAEAATGVHYPVPYAGMLYVTKNPVNTMYWQTYSVYNGGAFAGSVWTRTFYSGVWSAWSGKNGQAWTNLTFNTNWANYGSGYAVGQYCVDGNFVKLRGLVKTSVALTAASNIANIGTTLAPLLREIFSVTTSQTITSGAASAGTAHTHAVTNYTGRLDITNAGDLAIQCGSTSPFAVGGWVSLDGVYWDWTV